MNKDTVYRQDVIDALIPLPGIGRRAIDKVNSLPSAQPRGKWIYHIDDLFPAESTKECDQCHAEQSLICDDEFCPHCGAKMEVTE